MSLIGIEVNKHTAGRSGRPHSTQIGFGRLLDIAGAVAAILFLAPLLILAATFIKLQDGGPVLFRQLRVGRGGRLFTCYKLRSMVLDADVCLEKLLANDEDVRREWQTDHKLRLDPRVTPVGLFMRKSSIDELPQLFNVLRGDMCLVGPRPIIPSERVRYGHKFGAYCSVPPGITGLWQVSGRNDVSYRRRVAMDVIYSRSKSVPFDFLILLKTIPAVIARKGSY